MLDIMVFSTLMAVSFSSRFHLFIADKFNRILRKLKRSAQTREQLIEEFREKAIFKKAFIREFQRWDCIVVQLIGVSAIALLNYFSVYFAVQLLEVKDISQLSAADMFNVSNVAISGNNFIPIPGAEGTIQLILGIFIEAFAAASFTIDAQVKTELNQAIFVWRSFIFYLPVFVGFLFVPYSLWHHFRDEKSGKWKKLRKAA